MRSYTNKQGDKIEVSEEHLKVAVKIKKELQKASPSRKASWRLHKTLMEKEGFYDSDTNEHYRCLIKAFQKDLGELPEVAKYADMVADSKLESIKELVGDIAYEKRDNQKVLTELNKVKRELIDYSLFAEQIGKAFASQEFNLTPSMLERKEESDNKMIIQFSDFHIGAKVENEFNTYNFEVAKERMAKYLSTVIDECKRRNITSVYVMQTGDIVEHFQMHTTQAFEAEFILSEQINKASNIIVNALMTLANNGLQVTYAGIAGNHDRLNAVKNMSQHGDTVTAITNDAVKKFIEYSKTESVEFIEARAYEHSFDINGVKVKAIHGDRDNLKDDNLLLKHSELDDISYDLIIAGHIHMRKIVEVSYNKFIAIAGSLKGADNFTLDTLRKNSMPSQNFYIIDKDKNIEIRWVNLK